MCCNYAIKYTLTGLEYKMSAIIYKKTSKLDFFYVLCYPISGGEDMSKITLKNRLKIARAEKDLSQEDLARLVGVTRQTIWSIENEQYCPSALLLAKKLQKPVADLFFIEGDLS